MSKADEGKLSKLHGVIAEVLTAQIQHKTEETIINATGEVEGTGEMEFDASPAIIAAGIKFLKDNNITCDVSTNKNMGKLKEALDRKQKHSRLTDPKKAALSVVQ